MKTYFKIAWRNLWRNKRRSMITIASIFLGVVIATVMTSMQIGSYESMINTAVKFNTGYLQIQDTAYWDNKTIDNGVEVSDDVIKNIKALPEVTVITPRLSFMSLAYHGEVLSKPAVILGINIEEDDKILSITDKVVEGEMIDQQDSSCVIAAGLAEYLGLSVGDSIILMGGGYHGASAYALYPIKGILSHPNPEINRMMIYMPVELAQQMTYAYGVSSYYTIMVEDPEQVPSVKKHIESMLEPSQRVMTYDVMEKALLQQIESDRVGGYIMKGILYMIIAFGILGTVMMMMSERRRELAVMIAVGMKKIRLSVVIIIETVFMGMVGALLGLILSIPVVLFYYHNPILIKGEVAALMAEYGMEPVMYFALEPDFFLYQALIVLIISLVVGLYSLSNISKMNVINALRA